MSSATATRRDQTAEPAERIPPQDLQAERSVLGCLLLHAPAFDEVSDIVRNEDFYADKHRLVYSAICEMQAAGRNAIDIVTLSEWLTKSKTLPAAGGPAYLLELLEAVPHAAHAKHYAEIVRDKSRRRLAINAAQEMLHNAYDDAVETDDLFAQAELGLSRAVDASVANNAPMEVGKLLETTLANIEAGKPPVELISTGFDSIDQHAGFAKGGTTIIGAQTSSGKTALMLRMAVRLAEAGIPTLYWAYEQKQEELSLRILSANSLVGHFSMVKGYLTPSDRQKIVDAATYLHKIPLYLKDSIDSIATLQSVVRRAIRRNKIQVVFIDYIQIVPAEDRRAPREQQVSSVSRSLKTLAMSNNIAVVAACQLNRDSVRRENKKPQLSDLRESSAIGQDADTVMMLWRENMGTDDPAGKPDTFGQVVIAKNRNGPLKDVLLDWHGPTMRYSDPPSQADLVDQFEFNTDGPSDYR